MAHAARRCPRLLLALALAACAGAPPRPTLVVTADSVAGIVPDTDLDRDLARLFPDFSVEKTTFSAEGDVYARFVVRKADQVWLEVEPGGDGRGVYRVIIKSPALVTPAGARVGDPIDRVAARGVACWSDAEGAPRASCAGEPGFAYAVAIDDLAGAVGPEEKLPVARLAGRPIVEIRWLPPAPTPPAPPR